MFTVAPQLSDAVGGVNDGVAVQSIVLFAGTLPIVGAVTSVTLKGWLQVLLQLFASVTESESVYEAPQVDPATTETV